MLDHLPDDVREELLDPKYFGRRHYSRATYAKGCHGPLCKKAERERTRWRTEEKAEEAGRAYIPGENRRPEDPEILEALVWYLRAIQPKVKAKAS